MLNVVEKNVYRLGLDNFRLDPSRIKMCAKIL